MAAKTRNRGRRIAVARRALVGSGRAAPRRRVPVSSRDVERQIASALVEGRRIRLQIAARIERAFRARTPQTF